MLAASVTALVRFCTRFPWIIIVLGLAAAVGAATYAAKHFAITTDINKLISPNLDWRKREAAFTEAFPGHFGSTLIVLDAPTAELASQASAALTERLKAQPELFRSVEDTAASEFFAHNGLLFRSTEGVGQLTQGLEKSSALIGTLTGDPSLRGLTRTLSLVFVGVQNKMTTLDALARPFTLAATTIEDVLNNRPAAFSWHEMLGGKRPEPS